MEEFLQLSEGVCRSSGTSTTEQGSRDNQVPRVTLEDQFRSAEDRARIEDQRFGKSNTMKYLFNILVT